MRIRGLSPITLRMAFVAVLLLAGCWDGASNRPAFVTIGGYTSGSLYREDVHTVSVPIFTTDRRLFRRGLELRLTEVVIKRIESRTPYKVVATERADAILEGQVVDLTERVITKTLEDTPREVQVTVIVNVLWRDLRSGKVLGRAERLSERANVLLQAGDTVAAAADMAFSRLADRIVELLESDF